MSLSLCRVSYAPDYPVYREMLDSLTDPGAMGYEELLQAYQSRRNLYSHGFVRALRDQGIDAFEIYCDFEVLQKKWAETHGAKYSEENWQMDILLAQIRWHRPHVIYSDRFFALPAVLRTERKAFPWVRVLAAQQGFPMGFEELQKADIVFSCTPSIAQAFRDHGVNAHTLYHAFDPAVLQYLPEKTDTHDFVFTGHSGYGYDWHHRTRYEYLRQLLGTTCLEAWITERDRTLQPELETPLRELFPQTTHPPVFGMDMYRLLGSAKVVFNCNPDSTYGFSGIMREFESCGAMACLLTGWTENIAQLYEPDVEVVVYRSIEECREKLNYLLEHDEVRREIARRGHARVMREHLSVHRAERALQLLTPLL